MPEYQLQIKQVVDYPRCRIYREFIHKLINDRSIRINGGSGLFHFTVLCSYANFRTSYRRIDGISYTVSPGEWVCTVKELSCWFRTRFHRQALSMLDTLQKQHLISYTLLGRGNVVKYKILHWARHNSALEYNAPCQKDTGFFFLPVSVALELVSSARCSEMDIVLDLWVSAVYNDTQVQGSEVGPVAYFRNGTGNPLVSYTELSCRWGLSRATVCRILKKLDGLGYISNGTFHPGAFLLPRWPPGHLKAHICFDRCGFFCSLLSIKKSFRIGGSQIEENENPSNSAASGAGYPVQAQAFAAQSSLQRLPVCDDVHDVLPAGLCGNRCMDQGQRDHAGCIHPNPCHLHYRRHRHCFGSLAAHELLPFRTDGG